MSNIFLKFHIGSSKKIAIVHTFCFQILNIIVNVNILFYFCKCNIELQVTYGTETLYLVEIIRFLNFLVHHVHFKFFMFCTKLYY
jgi:hypothetical protein